MENISAHTHFHIQQFTHCVNRVLLVFFLFMEGNSGRSIEGGGWIRQTRHSGERTSYLDRGIWSAVIEVQAWRSLGFPASKQWTFWTLPAECHVSFLYSGPDLFFFYSFWHRIISTGSSPLFLVLRGKIAQAVPPLKTMSTWTNKETHLFGAVRPSQEHAGSPQYREWNKKTICVKRRQRFPAEQIEKTKPFGILQAGLWWEHWPLLFCDRPCPNWVSLLVLTSEKESLCR